MKGILKRVSALAYLEIDDALKLEADICDMISMADSLSNLQVEGADDGFRLQLGQLREDDVKNQETSKAVAFTNGLYVPRIRGV